MFKYTLPKTLAWSLVLFFFSRGWNYIDKITERGYENGVGYKPWTALLITAIIFSFLLGFTICEALNGM